MIYARRMRTLRGSAIRDVATEIAARNDPGLIKLSGGLPDGALFPLSGLQTSTEAIFTDLALYRESLQYGLTKGDAELVDILVERLNRREGLGIGSDNLLVTTGCQQGISLVSTALLDLGDTVLIEKPSYLDGLNAASPYQPQIVGVDTDDEGICLDKLDEALKAHPNTRFVYVIPNFQNPTGKAWSLARREAFLELLGRPEYEEICVVEDNPYGEIRFRGEFVPSLKALDAKKKGNKVIYLGSFSKILCPGLRVAYVVSSDAKFIERLEEIKEGADLQSNQFAQVQVREYMKRFDLDAHVETLKASYKGKCDAMIAALEREFPPQVAYTRPEGGMFLWAAGPSGLDTGKMLKQALDAGVSYIPGASFFAGGSGKNCMRLNFTANSVEKLEEGVGRLAGVLKMVCA